jgi:diguanylate cyclase (GGDEF)-like protein
MHDKRYLIATVSILLVVGFLATTLVSYFVSRASLRETIVVNELPLTSDNIYSEVQKDLISPVLISSMMASDTFARDWVLAGEGEVDQMTRFLREVMERYNAFTSFFVSERTRIYYHADGVLKTVSEAEPRDEWYFRVRRMAQRYEINVDPDMANQDALTIFINYRVLDYDGALIGVTGVGLTVNAVRNLIRDYQKRFQRTVYFVDSAGAIVLVSDADQVPEAKIGAREGMDQIVAQLRRDTAGTFQYTRQGHTHLANIRFIPELNWYLFVEKLEDEALSDVRHTLYVNLAICALITVLVLLATWFTINRFQDRLEAMATTDKLTGLASRHACDILMPEALKDAQRSGDSLAVILLDIDRFKTVNDTHGHLAGDRVICGVADIVRGVLPTSDIICRWGGEEFLIVLKNTSVTDAERAAEQIRQIVEGTMFQYGGQSMATTVSLGVARMRADETALQLIARADRALYGAKEAGRNRSLVASG